MNAAFGKAKSMGGDAMKKFQQLKGIYDGLDKDKNGQVSVDELVAAVKEKGLNFSDDNIKSIEKKADDAGRIGWEDIKSVVPS